MHNRQLSYPGLREHPLARPPEPPPTHGEAEIVLSLTVDGTEYAVMGVNVETLELHLRRYGVSGSASFWLMNDKEYGGEEEDKLYTAFCGSARIDLKVSVTSVRGDEEEDNSAFNTDPVPLSISAVVAEREVYEHAYRQIKDVSAQARCYRVTFHDPAALFWQQHFPCELYTDKSLQEVIDAHLLEGITVTYAGESFAQKLPHLFVPLDVDRGDPASFYDWLMWYCDHQDLLFTYDWHTGGYRIGEQLEETPTTLSFLARLDLARLWQRYPEVRRSAARVVCGTATDPRTSPLTAEVSLAPLSQDYLLRAPIGADFDARSTLETTRLRQQSPTLQLQFRAIPLRLFGPGDCVDLQGAKSAFQAVTVVLPDLATAGVLRFSSVDLVLRAVDPALGAHEIGNRLHTQFSLRAELEPVTERFPRFPRYVPPHYPRLLEGLILVPESDGGGGGGGSGGSGGGSSGGGGEEVDEIYEIETDEASGVLRYKVTLPTFANQIVRAPFDPGPLSGHFYFPLYKNARVLVALHCHHAVLRTHLDWRVGVQLPFESQGNQIMMGKKPSSSLILKTSYVDEKLEYTLQRISDKDLQVVHFFEGGVSFFGGEKTDDGTAAPGIKTTTAFVKKAEGVSLQVEDPDGKITNTIVVTGASMTLTSKGEKDTSTYVQAPDAITLTAKNITVTAETLSMTSSKTSSWAATETLSIDSTKDMTIHSAAAISMTADAAGSYTADELTLTASKAATLEGADTTVSGSSTLMGESPQVTLNGKTKVTVKGASAEVNGSSSLKCVSSGSAKLEGSMVTISGSLIKVG